MPRCSAWLIDVFVVAAGMAIAALFLFWVVESFSRSPQEIRGWTGSFLIVLWLVGNWWYDAYLNSGDRRGTIGKRIMNLQVTDEAGHAITFERATVRHLIKFLSFFPALLGYLFAALNRRRQCLQDLVAGTLVVQR